MKRYYFLPLTTLVLLFTSCENNPLNTAPPAGLAATAYEIELSPINKELPELADKEFQEALEAGIVDTIYARDYMIDDESEAPANTLLLRKVTLQYPDKEPVTYIYAFPKWCGYRVVIYDDDPGHVGVQFHKCD